MSEVIDAFSKLDYGVAPESPELADAWLDSHDRRFGHWINGAWTPPSDALRGSRCPADGSLLAQVSEGDGATIDQAVGAARAGLEEWQQMDGASRGKVLYAIARLLQRNARLFSVLESLDNGKPIRESRDLDIPLVVRHFYHHAGWATLLDSEFPSHKPVGVVGQIIPWNFPLLMLAWKVAPALAAGNAVVLKPAEFTPLTALLFAELSAQAGLPKGVLNVVTGGGEAGAALVRHPDVDKIAFTGSTEVGRDIRVATAGSGKGLSLELGGKSPFIVFESADLDGAVEGVVDAIWFNQGQVCCAGSRILVQESIAEDFHTRLRARMETLRMGHPLEKSVDVGAIVDQVQLDRIRELVAVGESEGAKVWQPSFPVPEQGCFFPPTLCTEVETSSTIATEEIFGPVAVSMTFRTPDEAVALANDTRYGLAASVWTEDINVALDVAPRILAGTVWVNCTNLFDGAVGFGGYKESGFGQEGGIEGMWEYLKSHADPTPSPSFPDGVGVRIESGAPAGLPEGVDRTRKLYIGGKQARPDGGYSLPVYGADGAVMGDAPRGNRKDVRNAVAAAGKAQASWGRSTAHGRAQILYFFAENLAQRSTEFAALLSQSTGCSDEEGVREVEAAVRCAFTFAAWADKYDGRAHRAPFRNVTLAMNEPAGVVAARCRDSLPLLEAVGVLSGTMAAGASLVLVPSQRFPLAGLELVSVIETSDIPAGVVNVVTGLATDIVPTLAAHDDVDDVWDFVGDELTAEVERLSAGNLKRVWAPRDLAPTWIGTGPVRPEEVMRRASRVKNIWVPYGA